MKHKIRVLVVDDHAIVRRGVRALLGELEDIELVGEAADGLEAVKLAAELTPDVILMDLVMPELDGIQATAKIAEGLPGIHILALTSFSTDDKVLPAIKAGAAGYILKDSEPDELIRAIRAVNRGELTLQPKIARKVLQEINQPAHQIQGPDKLTEREFEVLRLLARGWTNQEIARELVIAEVTVRTHVSRILNKLHLANRVQATLFALREEITSLDEASDDPPPRD